MDFNASSLLIESSKPDLVKDSEVKYERPNPLRDKSFACAVSIGRIAMPLCEHRTTYYAGNQLLRSSSSVAANISEANGASSPKDFVAKLHISLKEARESRFWIRYAVELKLLHSGAVSQPLELLEEITRMLKSAINTTKVRHLS